MAEPRFPARGVPLLAFALAGCGAAEAPANRASGHDAVPKAELTPVERAEALVRERLNVQAVSFERPQTFTSQGATVVCGRYRLPDTAPQRYIAVGEEDVFVEGEWSGDMDQAVRETCRNA